MHFSYILLFLAFYLVYLNIAVKSENDHFFLKAAKSVPRIGRRSRNQNIDDSFEKFFLKASKSVPRIGRRGPMTGNFNDDDTDNSDFYYGWQDMYYNPNMRVLQGYQQDQVENQQNSNQQKEITEFRLQPDRFM